MLEHIDIILTIILTALGIMGIVRQQNKVLITSITNVINSVVNHEKKYNDVKNEVDEIKKEHQNFRTSLSTELTAIHKRLDAIFTLIAEKK